MRRAYVSISVTIPSGEHSWNVSLVPSGKLIWTLRIGHNATGDDAGMNCIKQLEDFSCEVPSRLSSVFMPLRLRPRTDSPLYDIHSVIPL